MELDLDSQSQRLNSKPHDHLDQILSQKIGVGKAQDTLIFPLNILMFSEGCESVVIGLLLTELQREWGISTYEKSLLITAIYLGVSIGSFIQSYSDYIGRTIFIKWNCVLQLVFGLLSCIAPNMSYFIVLRFIYGIGLGIVFPLSATYISQCTPSENRAIILTKSRVCWSLGCMVACILSWILLYSHSWRTLLLIVSLPGAYALYAHLKSDHESLRFLWANKRTDQVYQLLKYMAQLNQKKPISKQQITYLIAQKQDVKQGQFKDLLNEKYKYMTLYLTMAWFSGCFIYYGILLLLPTILAKNTATSYHFKFISLILISVVEVFCFHFSRAIMDHPKIGRKKSTYIGFGTVAACSLMLIIVGDQSMYVLLGMFFIMKMFMTTTFMTLYPYSTQLYTTLIRGRAMGIFSLFGRIATTLLGFVGVNAIYWLNGNGLYLLFFSLSALSSFFVFKMPYCTLGRALDT